MDYLQFGNEKVAAVTDASNNYSLSVNYTSDWTISDRPFVWKGFPLTSYTDGLGNYSLAVILETGDTSTDGFGVLNDGEFTNLDHQAFEVLTVSPLALGDETYVYKGNRYGLAYNTTGSRLLSVTSSGDDTDVAGYTVWRGQKFAFNAERQLLLTQASGTQEQTDLIFVGGMPMKVARIGRKWYLCACDLA